MKMLTQIVKWMGNRQGIAVRLKVHDTTLCFVNCRTSFPSSFPFTMLTHSPVLPNLTQQKQTWQHSHPPSIVVDKTTKSSAWASPFLDPYRALPSRLHRFRALRPFLSLSLQPLLHLLYLLVPLLQVPELELALEPGLRNPGLPVKVKKRPSWKNKQKRSTPYSKSFGQK